MRVYRMGHESQTSTQSGTRFPLGPYSLDWADRSEEHNEMVWSHSGSGSENHHPAPRHCPKLRNIFEWEVCGFESLDALLDWFESWHRSLSRDGFRVWVYDVPEDLVRVGRFGQVVFPSAEAALVETTDIPLADSQLSLF